MQQKTAHSIGQRRVTSNVPNNAFHCPTGWFPNVDQGIKGIVGLNEGQSASIFKTIEQYHKNEKQKANQGLALSKGIGETQRKGFARHEEGRAEKIAAELRRQPYNEAVAERMKKEKLKLNNN